MSYLLSQGQGGLQAGARFRQLVERPHILRLPGAYNGMSAQQARNAGFEALYLSGAAMSASMGIPDLGIISKDDVVFFIRQLCRAADLPVLVDGDTGFGGILNVMDMVRSFEDAGAAAVQIEDQNLPKKCGHLNDKSLIAPEEMAAKIAAAIRVRRHLFIVARTDAAASEGIEGAIARARLYVEAGADAIFPEALTDRSMFEAFAREIKVPLLANMTEFGRTPPMSGEEFERLGYRMVIWPVSALRIAARAQEAFYAHLQEHDRADALIGQMQTRAELYNLIAYSAHEALDGSVQKTILTAAMRGQV